MKFSEMPYSRPDLEAMKANLTACTEAFLAAESAQEQIAQYDRVTDLSVEFNTMGSLANARHTIDTRDEFYDAESTFFDESWPQLSVYFQRLNEAMLDSKFRPELDATTQVPVILPGGVPDGVIAGVVESGHVFGVGGDGAGLVEGVPVVADGGVQQQGQPYEQ